MLQIHVTHFGRAHVENGGNRGGASGRVTGIANNGPGGVFCFFDEVIGPMSEKLWRLLATYFPTASQAIEDGTRRSCQTKCIAVASNGWSATEFGLARAALLSTRDIG